MANHTPADSAPDAPLAGLLAEITRRHAIRFEAIAIGGLKVEVLQLADMTGEVDRILAEGAEPSASTLPFWAKIWNTSLLLSYFIQRLEVRPSMRVLEIGAGVGVCGLFAARMGFATTISDIHPDAILFIKAGILKNSLGHLAQARRVDFTQDRLGERFDLILGSEVLYQDEAREPLGQFLKAHLAPDGEAVLAREYIRARKSYEALAAMGFLAAEKTIGIKAGSNPDSEKHLSTILRLKLKP